MDTFLDTFHEQILKHIQDPKLYQVAVQVFGSAANPNNFLTWPGGIHHHAFKGGLVHHTHEVFENCVKLADLNVGKVNKDILLTAALWHDFGKMWEYDIPSYDSLNGKPILKYNEPQPSKWRKKIHHSKLSAAHFLNSCEQQGKLQGWALHEDVKLEVFHCILAHHGFNTSWSKTSPETIEATLLYTADMLSAYYGPTSKRSHS